MNYPMKNSSNGLLLLALLMSSGYTQLHADDNEGWFEISRGAVLSSMSSAVVPVNGGGSQWESAGASLGASAGAAATLADEELIPRGQLATRTSLPDNGWQAVPSIRHDRINTLDASRDTGSARQVTQKIPDVPGTSRSASNARSQNEVASGSRSQDVVSPTKASHGVAADNQHEPTANVAGHGTEPLILSRGEIQEFSGRRSRQTARNTAQQDLVGQPARNRLPASGVSTVNVDMFAGEVKVLGKVDVTRVAIGNGDIVRAEVLKSGELLVIGEMEGSTSLRLWHSDKTQSDYNIRVSGSDPETRVRMETMVRMRVRMIEFRKSALGKLGIDWSDSASGPGFAIAGDAIGNNLFRLPAEGISASLPNTVKPFSTYFGVASSITSRINFLASTGDATTLAEPVLSTTNGGSASFLAGGEVPYPSIGANGQTVVQFKEYGIKLNVSPRIDALGNVRTLVQTEISQLDPAVSVQGTPGLLTRRAQTQVNVRSGETIVISGLLSSESSKDVDKLPGIGNLPVIGSFFRSKNARNAVSELVIFVTPEIVEPEGELLNQRQQQFLSRSEQQLSQAQRQIRLLD